jgi:hypothetical protein
MAIQKTYDDGKKHVHVLSYGGGTQSTALLLMALKGEVNGVIPDYIIFSDTGWEPKSIYEWVEKVNEHIKKKHSREIIITDNGNIREDTLKGAEQGVRFASMPFFTKDKFNQKGMVMRQCTQEYKIMPVNRKIRSLLGYEPRKRVKEVVHVWKGISTDEIQRVKPSQIGWQVHEHPLVDYLEMDRDDCIKYVEEEGLGTPEKSSCIGCPFHSNEVWLDMKKNDPESWADAVEFDKKIRNMPRLKAKAYLHRSGIPLDEIEFKEQMDIDEFIAECTGMCGN